MDKEGAIAGEHSALQHAFSLALPLQVILYIPNFCPPYALQCTWRARQECLPKDHGTRSTEGRWH